MASKACGTAVITDKCIPCYRSMHSAFSIVLQRFPVPRHCGVNGQRHHPIHTQGAVVPIWNGNGSQGLRKRCDHSKLRFAVITAVPHAEFSVFSIEISWFYSF